MSEPSTRRLVRLLGATVVGGLTIGFLPGVASATAPEPPAEQSTSAFCANVPADYEPFTDVTGNKANIECAAAAGLTMGTSTPTLYNPGGIVSRAQMASFIARLIDAANALDAPGAPALADLPAYDGTNEFTDNPDPAHVANINRLADANIVLGGPGGTSPSTYGGGLPVQRDQMASFINRTQDFLVDGQVDGDGYSSSENYFLDDDASVHHANINAIASRGIAIGDGIDTYNPSSGVTRDQMASFLVRHGADNFEAGVIGAVPAPVGNATLSVTPAADASLVAVTPNPDTDTSDDRQYTVTGLTGSSYGIQLFPSGNVSVTGSTYSFADADATANVADPGTPAADITVVNGAAQVAGTTAVASVAPVGGQVTFTVDGDTPESVTPVVYAQTGATTGLDLNAANQPTEAFGVGGAVNYVPAEAPGGAIVAGLVATVDKTANSFASATATYEYDANDTFSVGGVPSTLDAFEAQLSSGDTVSGTYAPDPAAPSSFALADTNPGVPTAPAATASGGNVSLAFTAPAGDVDSYNVYRALSANNTDCTTTGAGSYSLAGATDASPFVDITAATPEQYCYTVAAVNDGDESDRSTAAFVSLTAADAASPTSADVRLTTSAGVAGQLDPTDEFKVAFSEPMNAALSDTLVVRDADGTFATIVCLAPAAGVTSCALNAAAESVGGVSYPIGQVMTVTLGTAPVQSAAGTVPGLQVPTTITDHSGVADAAGNAWNIAGSADVIIDIEA